MTYLIGHPHRSLFASFLALIGLSLALSVSGAAQNADQTSFGSGRNNQNDQPKTVKEYLAKQRAEKAVKEHEELLKRGDELLSLTDQLETAYELNNTLNAVDRAKLESVEKLAERIRKSLGGDGEDEDRESGDRVDEDKDPSTVKDAVVVLKEVAVRLVDELKRTSRFTISAVAIQSSNSVLKLVKFLRLRR